ncbi:MAG: hypothetical protein U1F25_09530 [Rubrivivax sp.]
MFHQAHGRNLDFDKLNDPARGARAHEQARLIIAERSLRKGLAKCGRI